MTGTIQRHGNKVVHGLSLGTIIWMYATFCGKDDCRAARAEQWRNMMDVVTVHQASETVLTPTNSVARVIP